MRGVSFLVLLLVTGCESAGGPYPSLQPRAAEAIDPRVPVAEPILPTEPTAGLARQLDQLVTQAVAGDDAFRPAAEQAVRLAGAAGAPQSESWIVAQQALSVLVAARAPVVRAMAEVDGLGAKSITTVGGIGAADLKAIQGAASRIADIDSREAEVIARLQARLGS